MRKLFNINFFGIIILVSMAVFAGACDEESQVITPELCGPSSPDWPGCKPAEPPPTLPTK